MNVRERWQRWKSVSANGNEEAMRQNWFGSMRPAGAPERLDRRPITAVRPGAMAAD